MRLNKDLRELVELLNTNRVDYLVVGAFAVAWHGHPRFTNDIDFLVRPSIARQAFFMAGKSKEPADLYMIIKAAIKNAVPMWVITI